MVKSYKVGSHISQEPDLILEEQLLLSPGLWKGVKFTREEIIKGIKRTDWQDSEVSSILKKHPKFGSLPSAEDWIGDLKNIRYLTLEDGVDKEGMYADAYIYDPSFSKKVAYGKAKLAFSIDSPFKHSNYGATNLSFGGTATVYRAGCKDAYIQLSDSEEEPKMRFISEDLKIQLEGEVTSESSQGDVGEEHANQPVKKVIFNESDKIMEMDKDIEEIEKNIEEVQNKIDKLNLHIDKKGEIKRVMEKNTSNSSVQLEAAPVATQEVTPTPAVVAPVPQIPVVETPVVAEPTPVQAKPVPEVVQPKPVVDNSKDIGELKSQVRGFESKMTELTNAILELSKPKEVPVAPTPVVAPETPTPVVVPKVETPKTEVVEKPAIAQTVPYVEENLIEDDSHLTQFEKAHKRLNSRE